MACLAIGWEQPDPRCFCRHRGTTVSPLLFCFALSFSNYFVSSSSLPPSMLLLLFLCRKSQHEQRKEQEPKRPHIKKPLNAFMLYMKEMRANVVAECTLKESAAINQILGRRVGQIVWYTDNPRCLCHCSFIFFDWVNSAGDHSSSCGSKESAWTEFPGPISLKSTKIPLSINIQPFMN